LFDKNAASHDAVCEFGKDTAADFNGCHSARSAKFHASQRLAYKAVKRRLNIALDGKLRLVSRVHLWHSKMSYGS
jgi:hypothetical protein